TNVESPQNPGGFCFVDKSVESSKNKLRSMNNGSSQHADKEPQALKKVRLVTREEISLGNMVCRIDETFVRLGPKLVAGIYNKDGESFVYLWQEWAGLYYYIGDLGVYVKGDGTALGNFIGSNGMVGSALENASLAHYREEVIMQHKNHVNEFGVIHQVSFSFLVGANDAAPKPAAKLA